jgi:integrase
LSRCCRGWEPRSFFDTKARKIGADTLDALNAHLKRCARICARLPKTEHYADGSHACDERCGPLRDHRTSRPHACDERCTPHACKSLKASSRVKVLSIISAALALAKRYKWVDSNVAVDATMPNVGRREPDPPTLLPGTRPGGQAPQPGLG